MGSVFRQRQQFPVAHAITVGRSIVVIATSMVYRKCTGSAVHTTFTKEYSSHYASQGSKYICLICCKLQQVPSTPRAIPRELGVVVCSYANVPQSYSICMSLSHKQSNTTFFQCNDTAIICLQLQALQLFMTIHLRWMRDIIHIETCQNTMKTGVLFKKL